MRTFDVTNKGCRVSALTLIELLVVIAVIGVLASLLLPALLAVKGKALGAYCLSNGRQLALAFHSYASDFGDWFPPNPEDGHSTNMWVTGDMKKPSEATNVTFLTNPEFAKLAPYCGRTATIYKCPADKSTVTIGGVKYARVRSFSMNQAVGTKPDAPRTAVDGPWLDNTHHHVANRPWRTYARYSDIVNPSPAGLWILIDEEQRSINDGAFGVSMEQPTRFIDWPGTYHNSSCGIALADGHSVIHKWLDVRTRLTGPPPLHQRNNLDVVWLQEHTSSRMPAEK